jgi:hypothetical protein
MRALGRGCGDGQACRWGRIAEELHARRDLGWEMGHHTWAGYSELDGEPLAPRPLVVTDGAAPSPEYEALFESGEGVKLYSRDRQVTEWLARQCPPAGAGRYPWVFARSLLPSAD